MALKFKKRNILLAILAVEILTLPVSAKVVDKMLFTLPADAAIVNLPNDEPGFSRLVVVSNSSFVLTSKNAVGNMDISVHLSGWINETRFGDNAQLPGPVEACSRVGQTDETVIYASDQRTAARRGEVLSRSVIIEVEHAPGQNPEFNVTPTKSGKDLPVALACDVAPV